MLHHIGRMTCDSHHNFPTIQGIECVTNCLNFCTLWEGVWKYIFSISDFVQISFFFSINKHSNNSPTSSVDEIPVVSPFISCKFYTLAHDHGVHDFFIKYFTKKKLIHLIQVNINICSIHIVQILCLFLSKGRIFLMWFCLFPKLFGHYNC